MPGGKDLQALRRKRDAVHLSVPADQVERAGVAVGDHVADPAERRHVAHLPPGQTLLTTAGMQQMTPYFLGLERPPHTRMTSIQKCFRTVDIDEVGDESSGLEDIRLIGLGFLVRF